MAQNIYSSQGIIHYPTQLHLVGHFRILLHTVLGVLFSVIIKQNLYIMTNRHIKFNEAFYRVPNTKHSESQRCVT
jgi:hypothetical protein